MGHSGYEDVSDCDESAEKILFVTYWRREDIFG
jgi:hypothetical protein